MGVPRNYIKDEWKKVLIVFQKFITREGHYAITYQYHIGMLLHLEANMTLNFPLFLIKSLRKMSIQVSKNTKNPLTILHHLGLINILICFELQQCHDTWENFIERNQFKSPVSSIKPPRPLRVPIVLNEEVDPPEDDKPPS